KQKNEMNEYMEGYIDFLNNSKTEYKAIENIVDILNKNGFVDILTCKNIKAKDKVYFVNKDKSIYAAIIGSDDILNGINLIGSHVDSPRIDLKPIPLYENQGVCLLKTQYYGGIKKYQWVTTPLSMIGVVYNKNNEKINIEIGEDKNDPCFTITDILPHLANDQLKLKASEFIDPEKMSITFGSYKDKDSIKDNILKLLNEKYGIDEIDFARSEIEFVPCNKARFVGIDKSMIGGYGQDDRVCVYASLKAFLSNKNTNKTNILMIVDKEEIGSVGNTSMATSTFDMFIKKIINKDVDINEVYYNSKMLSADVSAGVDPNYDEVSDIQNSNMLGCGVCIEKYTGSGGKFNASDANAKYISYIMNKFDNKNVKYQIGTLGKVDKGGGGTICYILANKGIDVIDVGTPVISMHSPFEITSVTDVYMTYLAYIAFME
ncbi:MAG: aminopeptidase, partial [Clostridia bacterium]